MAVLVIADHDGERLNAGVRNVVTCAKELSEEVVVLVVGEDTTQISRTATGIAGVTRVLSVSAPIYKGSATENVALLVASLAPLYSHVLVAATSYGKNLAPRVAGLLDVQPISDVIEVLSHDTFKRPTYAGNLITTVRTSDAKKILTVRTTAFAAASQCGEAPMAEMLPGDDSGLSQVKSIHVAHSDRPELAHARVIVSGGRGLGTAKNFEILTPFAERLGAAIGASRAAVDLGFVPNDFQIGQTGKVVAPEIYVAVGISGAIQHLAGMRDSKFIFAINRDPEAPICAVADFWLAEDLFSAVPIIVEALPERRP